MTGCGSHMHSVKNSGACGVAYAQPCLPNGQAVYSSRYGDAYHQQTEYHYNYVPAPYVAPTLIPAPQAVISYVPEPTPPTPVYEPAPIIEPAPIYEAEPIYEPAPVLDTPPPLNTWTPQSWVDDPLPDEFGCPEGTIQGYGGSGCVEVTIPRK